MKRSTKNIIKAGILAFFIITLFAIGTTKVKANTEQCGEWHKLAVVVMDARQNGDSIVDLLDVADTQPQIEREVIAIITAAYEISIYASDENKKLASTEFANIVFMICYRANGESI